MVFDNGRVARGGGLRHGGLLIQGVVGDFILGLDGLLATRSHGPPPDNIT